MKRLLVFLALALIPGTAIAQAPQISDSAGVRVVTNAAPGPDAPRFRLSARPRAQIGTVEGAAPYQLFRAVDGTILSDGTILLVNRGTQEARFFDQTGKYLRSLGKEGQGPGEFVSIALVGVLAGDSLVFSDGNQARYSVFTSAGKFARSIPIPTELGPLPNIAGLLSNRRVLVEVRSLQIPLVKHAAQVERQPVKLVYVSLDDGSVQPFGEFRGREVATTGTSTIGVIFGYGLDDAARGGRMAVGNNDAYSIRIYDASGKMTLIVREKRTAEKARRGEWEEALPRGLADGPSSFNDRFKPLFDVQPHREMKPLFGGVCDAPTCLRFDHAGNLWVAEYGAPSQTSRVTTWHVFDSRGVFVGRFEPPARSTILDSGADWILLNRKDDLDVEHVVLYGLERP